MVDTGGGGACAPLPPPPPPPDSAGHSAMKKTEKKGKKKWEDNIKECIGIDFATSTRPLKTGLGGMGMS